MTQSLCTINRLVSFSETKTWYVEHYCAVHPGNVRPRRRGILLRRLLLVNLRIKALRRIAGGSTSCDYTDTIVRVDRWLPLRKHYQGASQGRVFIPDVISPRVSVSRICVSSRMRFAVSVRTARRGSHPWAHSANARLLAEFCKRHGYSRAVMRPL